jgi:hypothetical protein
VILITKLQLLRTWLDILPAEDGLTSFIRARFESQLAKPNKVFLEFIRPVKADDFLPTHLPDKIQKPKWVKP